MKKHFGKNQANFCVNVFEPNQKSLTPKNDTGESVSMKTVICSLNNQLQREHISSSLLFFSGVISLIIIFASQFEATATYVSLGIFFFFLLWKFFTSSASSQNITFLFLEKSKEKYISRYAILRDSINQHIKTKTLFFRDFIPFIKTNEDSSDEEKSFLKPDFLSAFPSVDITDCTVYFLPIGIITYSKKGYSFFQFNEENLLSVSTKCVETTAHPTYDDARKLGQRYLHMNKNGTPDMRFTNNPLYITYEYGALLINLIDNGPLEFILPSKKAAETLRSSLALETHEVREPENKASKVTLPIKKKAEEIVKTHNENESPIALKKEIAKPITFSFSRDYKNTAPIAFLHGIGLIKNLDANEKDDRDYYIFYFDDIASKIFAIYWCQLDIGNVPATYSKEYFPLIEYIKQFRINYYRLFQAMKIKNSGFDIWKENARKYLSGTCAFDYDRLQINIADIIKKIANDEFGAWKFKGKAVLDFSNPLGIGIHKNIYNEHFQKWDIFLSHITDAWSAFFENYQEKEGLSIERPEQVKKFLGCVNGEYFFEKLPIPENPIVHYAKEKADNLVLSDSEKEVFSKLDKDYYTKAYFLKYLSNLGIEKRNIPDKTLIETFGFYMFSDDVVLKKKWHNFESIIKSRALTECTYEVDSTLAGMDFYQNCLRKLARQGYLIKIDEFTYLTKKALLNEGINEIEIGLFCQQVRSFSQEHAFFSIKQISDIGISKVTTSKNKQILIENIVIKMPDIQSICFSDGKLFTFSNRQVTRLDYIEAMMLGKTSMDAFDFIYYLKKEHGVVYKIEALVKDINSSQMYYNEDTEKIYIDKKTFIQEVFGNV